MRNVFKKRFGSFMYIKSSTLCVSEKSLSTVLPIEKNPINDQWFAPKSHVQNYMMSLPFEREI